MSAWISALIAITIILLGAVAFGWLDLFHLVIGLPPLLVGALFVRLLRKRMDAGPEDDKEPDGSELGRKVFIGVLQGVASLILLWVAFYLASDTQIEGVFYGPACRLTLVKIEASEAVGAYGLIVQSVEERLRHRTSTDCRQRLIEKKLGALLKWAGQLQEPERKSKLDQAQREAEQNQRPDLAEVAKNKLEVEALRQEVNKLNEELKRKEEMLEVFRWTERGLTATLSNILFETGRAELTAAARQKIEQIANILNRSAAGKQILIEGHTDATGSAEENQKLSEERAARVREALAAAGVGLDRTTSRGFGRDQPIACNHIPEGREKNRRVEIVIRS
ncbi:MAG: OmpA family protein [Blastocatellia bacterium]